MTGADSPWLDDVQQQVWRRWILLGARLDVALARQMAESDLSLADFAVLVQLSEAPKERIRVVALSKALEWERSRVSHQVARMERRGLVSRRASDEDGRGSVVVLTAAGRRAIVDAAPGHATAVKSLFFSDLTAEELTVLGDVFDRVLGRLADAGVE